MIINQMIKELGDTMFGYVTVNQKELTKEDYKVYHGFYCGLCQMLKKRHGKLSQLMLNNDMTFLVLLLTALYEAEEIKTTHRCLLHPKQKEQLIQNKFTEYGADMTVLLTYHKCIDDWQDEHSYLKKGVSMAFRNQYNEIRSKYKRQAEAIERCMEQNRIAEKELCLDIDYMSSLTGSFLSELFVYKEDMWQENLKKLGFYLGKFIYIMDAFEDQKKDKKHNNYNVLLLRKEQKKNDYMEDTKEILTIMMAECSKAFERLPIMEYVDILRNILYSGVWFKYQWIKKKKEEKNNERSL